MLKKRWRVKTFETLRERSDQGDPVARDAQAHGIGLRAFCCGARGVGRDPAGFHRLGQVGKAAGPIGHDGA
jgi:hypothetical protein